jgi:hypothetical protein
MTTLTYGTINGSTYGMTLLPESAETRPRTPAELIVTQAVQTKDGWLGQVIVDKEIVWEGSAVSDGDEAVRAANARVVQAFKALLAS